MQSHYATDAGGKSTQMAPEEAETAGGAIASHPPAGRDDSRRLPLPGSTTTTTTR